MNVRIKYFPHDLLLLPAGTGPHGQVALVAGATRGAGRGIAVELGAAGATVYVTAGPRPAPRPHGSVPRPSDETAELVNRAGGTGIPSRPTTPTPARFRSLIERIDREHSRLDLLVNDIWGGDPLPSGARRSGNTTWKAACGCCAVR